MICFSFVLNGYLLTVVAENIAHTVRILQDSFHPKLLVK